MSNSNAQLKQAFELIKAGNKSAAVDLLLPILKVDKDNADAWWLMANALSEPDDIREALETVLRLRPDNDRARQMLTKLNQKYPPKPANDDFAFDDDDNDLFAEEYDDYQPKAYERGSRSGDKVALEKPKGGTNPLVIILAVIGVIGVIGCGVCFFAVSAGLFTVGQVVSEAVNDPTFAAALDEIAQSITAVAVSQTLPTDLRMQGGVERGQTVTGNVDTFDDDGWTLNTTSGNTFTIELNALSGELDPQLFVYGPNGSLLAENDDIAMGTNNNSRLTINAPENGTYTIVVSAFGSGGAYELIVR